ncbi:uncharacterized protein LOC104434140 isoform X3 [Eucalyptus grandis]|uniref:uncharacterized protein LOC104434140 isoform X3 n=1 Tax=Eucalyptus grandis TaxID=71139 RepID=UPI0005278930|nr:uncharacterized protein LOC104434140 isoform X3 [Eucalyptus grandis]
MPTKVHEAGTQFGDQGKALLPMNEVDNHVSNDQKKEIGHNTGIMYEPRTSVLDLLHDDPSDRNLEISPANEDHVAFSVNGLGRVGTETPAHSPPQVDRTFSYGCASPLKHSGWSDMSENQDHALDDLDFEAVRCLKSMMKSFNVPNRRHSLRNSMGIGDWYGNLEANTCAWDKSNHHWGDSSIMTSSGHKDQALVLLITTIFSGEIMTSLGKNVLSKWVIYVMISPHMKIMTYQSKILIKSVCLRKGSLLKLESSEAKL